MKWFVGKRLKHTQTIYIYIYIYIHKLYIYIYNEKGNDSSLKD